MNRWTQMRDFAMLALAILALMAIWFLLRARPL
jgi:hypothetical protein